MFDTMTLMRLRNRLRLKQTLDMIPNDAVHGLPDEREYSYVANRELIERFEQKIAVTLARIWGEEH